MIVAIYINDLLFITSTREPINKLKVKLNKYFRFKHIGDIKTYLGIQVTRDTSIKMIYIT